MIGYDITITTNITTPYPSAYQPRSSIVSRLYYKLHCQSRSLSTRPWTEQTQSTKQFQNTPSNLRGWHHWESSPQPNDPYPCCHRHGRQWKNRTQATSKHNSNPKIFNKTKIFNVLSPLAPTPSITTIQQLGLGIVHALSTLILNSYKKLVYSPNYSPVTSLWPYDFLLPRDQEIP